MTIQGVEPLKPFAIQEEAKSIPNHFIFLGLCGISYEFSM